MKIAKRPEEWNSLNTGYSRKISRLQQLLIELNRLPPSPVIFAKKEKAERKLEELCESQKDFSVYYAKLKAEPTPESLKEEGFKTWKWIKDFKMDRRQYESFIVGYLDSFENNRPDADKEAIKDYTVYFDWGETRPEYDLILYLNPLEVEICEPEPVERSAGKHVKPEAALLSPLAPPPAAPTDPIPPSGPPPPKPDTYKA